MTELGKNIRLARKHQKKSLQEIADMVQITPSFLSQIENGKNEPSLTTLKRIANYLSVPISRLLGEEESHTQMLVRAGERHQLVNLAEGGLTIEFLSAFDPQNVMEVCIHNIAPGAKSGAIPYAHEGQEVFIALEGCIALTIDDTVIQMEEGDCYYLNDCSRAHLFSNASGTKEARMLCITNPPYFYSCKQP